MVRTFQTLFQAVFVYAFGIGIGLAWQQGWIPVELTAPNTGTIRESETVSGELPLEPVPAPPLVAGPPVELKPVPSPLERAITQPASVLPFSAVSSVSSEKPRSAEESRSAVPEWAREGNSEDSAAVTAASVTGTATNETATPIPHAPNPTVRLVSNEVPESARPAAQPDSPPNSQPASPPDLAAIDEQIRNQEILPAHRALSKLYWNDRSLRAEVLPRMEQTARLIFFSPQPHFVEPYVIAPNDQLRTIARQHQLSWEYLAALNRVDPRRIQSGQKLKVLKGPFAAVVNLNEFTLTVHLQGYFVKRYVVGIGKDGASPIGKFTVLNKVENPQYTGPDGRVISGDDPANPLGERWIDLGDSYGIHGTIEPESIGKAASRGCIRMQSDDVIEVYNFLVKGSEVVIRR